MTIVLPHGVLFRGGEEGEIRKNLIENNHVDAIIGLPANIFFGTGIPTVILVLRQQRDNNDVLIIDASKHFTKVGNNNKLQASDIKRMSDTVIARENRPHYSKVVSKQSIRDNDYNLNIPRYVDSSEASESWDLHAIMLGGIPQGEIDALSHYWHALPALQQTLFSQRNAQYAELNSELDQSQLKQQISQHPQVQDFVQSFNDALFNAQGANEQGGFDQHLVSALINHWQNVKLKQQEEALSNELFTRLQPIALIDKYHAYQLLNNQWQIINNDLEILQTEGFAASKQVDPKLVTKKVRGKDTEVQDGWCGHILPFDLVQSSHLKAELQALSDQQNRLTEISAEVEAVLDGLSEEDKENDTIKDSGDGFINAAVIKEAKLLKKEAKENGAFGIYEEDSYQASILKVDKLISEEKALKKAVKTDFEALHLKTKATIEGLTDEQVNELLELKWITPLLAELNQLPTAIINELSQKLQNLADKYATTYADVANEIKTTEQSLATLLDELTGNEADQQGLAELKKLLTGQVTGQGDA